MSCEEDCDDYEDTDEVDEVDFPACCFCDRKYGSDYCRECPVYDGSACPSDEEAIDE